MRKNLASDNVAKFRGDRPTELGDLVAKQKRKEKKETSAVKHTSTVKARLKFYA